MYAEWFKWQVRAGAGQGTSSTETSISMQLYMGGGRKHGQFWQKTRTKKAEC